MKPRFGRIISVRKSHSSPSSLAKIRNLKKRKRKTPSSRIFPPSGRDSSSGTGPLPVYARSHVQERLRCRFLYFKNRRKTLGVSPLILSLLFHPQSRVWVTLVGEWEIHVVRRSDAVIQLNEGRNPTSEWKCSITSGHPCEWSSCGGTEPLPPAHTEGC